MTEPIRMAFDATCKKCGKRFGWTGGAIDRPPCPGCRDKIPREELEKSQKHIEEFSKKMEEKHKKRKAKALQEKK